jgi:hypothetical protein
MMSVVGKRREHSLLLLRGRSLNDNNAKPPNEKVEAVCCTGTGSGEIE